MANAREAPRFLSDHTGFDNFFRDVEELGRRAGISEVEKIDWAVRYANSEANTWMRNFDKTVAGVTLDNFKTAVLKRYPHLATDHRYTIRDLERIAARTRRFDDLTREDLGDYHRKFIDCSEYLISQGEINRREESEIYLDGFPSYLHTRILHRLSVKLPDVQPSKGYKLEDVHEAALFALDGFVSRDTRRSLDSRPLGQSSDTVAELLQALTRVLTTTGQSQQPAPAAIPSPAPRYPRPPTPGGVVQNAPRWNPPGPDAYRPPVNPCMFCSSLNHYVRNCPVAADYIQQGKITRNNAGKLCLPDGRYLPRDIPGNDMRERVDNYRNTEGAQNRDRYNRDNRDRPYRDNRERPLYDNLERPYQENRDRFRDDRDRNRENRDRSRDNRDRYRDDRDRDSRDPVSAHFLETSDEYVFSMDVSSHDDDPRYSRTSDDEYIAEQLQIAEANIASRRESRALALQGQKTRFDGIELTRKHGPPPNPPRRNPAPPTQSTQHPRGTRAGDQPRNQSRDPPRDNNRDKPPHVVQRTQGPMKPVTMVPKPPAEDHKFRYQSAIENSVKTTDIVDRFMNSTFTLSARELLGISPDARRQVKDMVVSKKVSANFFEDDGTDSYLSSLFEQSAPLSDLDLEKYEYSPSAAPSLPLRVIFPVFAPGVEPECILDGGAQIVVMRKDIWEKLRAPITASKFMTIESASSGKTTSLGLVEDHPVRIGPITVFLQIQVVDSAPFEVLLGRPFFDITSCREISHQGGNHEIHLKDPKSGEDYVFPTRPRLRKPPVTNQPPAVNFRG